MNDMQVYGEGFSQQQIEQLDTPLDANLIKHRTGSGGRKLAYLKGSTEIEYANKIFGYGRWGYRIVSRSLEKSCDLDGRVTGYFYTVDLELFVLGAAFPFPGDGVGPVTTNTPDAHESARKAATTDALKRALRHYGNAFGLPLYDEDALVDAGDGVMVPVKQVKPGRSVQPAKSVIESAQRPMQIASAPSTVSDIPTPSKLIERCDVLFGPNRWIEVKQRVLGADISDDNLTPDHCSKISRSFDIVQEKRNKSA